MPKILIFITDGRPQDRKLVPRYAQSLRDKKIRIFAIGVGEATEEELKEIASEPHDDHVIFISGGNNKNIRPKVWLAQTEIDQSNRQSKEFYFPDWLSLRPVP